MNNSTQRTQFCEKISTTNPQHKILFVNQLTCQSEMCKSIVEREGKLINRDFSVFTFAAWDGRRGVLLSGLVSVFCVWESGFGTDSESRLASTGLTSSLASGLTSGFASTAFGSGLASVLASGFASGLGFSSSDLISGFETSGLAAGLLSSFETSSAF